MQVVGTLQELDAKLRDIDAAAAESDDAARRVFASFRMDFAALNRSMPEDPFSDDYYRFQMSVYENISGRSYAVSNEVSAFDVPSMVRRPFPYSSGSTATAGMHLSAMGFVIGNLRLQPGARVLEFGPGWGNTTLALASLGFNVTAVDVEANFCELIRARAALNGVSIQVVNADFFWCEGVSEPYDAILFYECFHHCSDHMRLLRGLHRALKPHGRVFLGAEPIKEDFPLPWGMRLDGESLWAIRQNGWMELGFNSSYFAEALRRTGWLGSVQVSKDVGWANLWELEEQCGQDVTIGVSDPRVESLVGVRGENAIAAAGSGPGYIVYGPRVALAAGGWSGGLRLTPGTERRGEVVLDVCSEYGQRVHACAEIDLGRDCAGTDLIEVPFELPSMVKNLEIRLFGKPQTVVSVEAVCFSRPKA